MKSFHTISYVRASTQQVFIALACLKVPSQKAKNSKLFFHCYQFFPAIQPNNKLYRMDGRRRRQYPLARPGLTTRNSQLQTGNCKLSCVTDAETEIRYYCVCIVLEVRRCRCLFPVGCCRCLSPVFPLLMKIEMSYWPGFASDSSLVGNHSFAAKLQI